MLVLSLRFSTAFSQLGLHVFPLLLLLYFYSYLVVVDVTEGNRSAIAD